MKEHIRTWRVAEKLKVQWADSPEKKSGEKPKQNKTRIAGGREVVISALCHSSGSQADRKHLRCNVSAARKCMMQRMQDTLQ